MDVGQVEGGLMMGLGYVLYEKEVYDPHTGKVLSNSTWVSTPNPTYLDKTQTNLAVVNFSGIRK